MNSLSYEIEGVQLGDKRLNERSTIVLEALYHQSQSSIPTACGGWSETEAAYRFFQNSKVTAAKILAPHKEATLKRMESHEVVLLVQDTTELDYTGRHEKMKDLGYLNWAERRGCLLCHFSIHFC